jgi:hypothetical protein
MVLILLRLLMFAAFRINMWTRAKERRFLTHRLCSCILDDEPQGYSARNLDWEKILHGHAADLGEYKELAVLPDKIARYLYEFHAESYASHGLPALPVDRSRVSVHGILKPAQVYRFYQSETIRLLMVLILFMLLTEQGSACYSAKNTCHWWQGAYCTVQHACYRAFLVIHLQGNN